jgi:DNA-binding NarL/FixJ family response regulator
MFAPSSGRERIQETPTVRSVAVTPSYELVGRGRELARLADFAARLREGPSALLIRGEPGIGKTTLWREGIAAAQDDDVRVLVSRCAEAEMPISFGALADLVDPVYGDVADAIAEPQRRALAAALRVEDGGHERRDRLALPRALVATLQALAAEAPVLVAIDDVQWLDAPSARALAYSVRRVASSPIGVLATLRGGAEDPDPLRLADAFDTSFSEVALGPLSLSALQRLVRQRFDVRIPRSQLATVHAASGGNPMFALEFARVAEHEQVDLRAQLPVPSSLQELVRHRVRRLPDSTRPLLELVSAIERPTPPLLARALGQTSFEELADEAASAGALAVGTDGVVRFTHPLLGSAVYFDMPARRRRALHLEVAGLVDDLEERARHVALATTSPDGAIADVIERGADAAATRGAPDAAAALSAEAVRLTPTSDEPSRVRRTFAGAAFLMQAGDVPEARALIEPLLDPHVPAAVRSQALVMRAEAEHQDRARLRAFLREAIDIAPDPRVRWQAWIRLAQQGGFISRDVRAAAASAGESLRIAVELDDASLIAASTAALAFYEAVRGNREIEFGTAELDSLEHLPRAAPWAITPAVSIGARLLWAGQLNRARDVLRRDYDDLVRQGRVTMLPLTLMSHLSDLEWRAGKWAEAEQYAYEARAILEDAFPGGAHVLGYAQVVIAGSLGRVAEARTIAATDLETATRYQDLNQLRISWALGHVELAGGDAAAACQALEGMPEALNEFGVAEPGWQPILPDVVEALVSNGRLDDAESMLQQLEQQAAELDHRWATPAASRCRALVLLAHERTDEAAAAADAAAAAFADLGFPLDRARSLLAAGAARRRAGQRRQAAESLGSAIEILEELPAPLWLERAEEELRRASPRPRRDRDLTDAERRVAALVAQGYKNREVAAQLFTTVTTVEAHLTRIYRKLGIRSRTQLARAVADGTLELG